MAADVENQTLDEIGRHGRCHSFREAREPKPLAFVIELRRKEGRAARSGGLSGSHNRLPDLVDADAAMRLGGDDGQFPSAEQGRHVDFGPAAVGPRRTC